MKISITPPNLTRADLNPGTLFSHYNGGEVWLAVEKYSILFDGEFMSSGNKFGCVSLSTGKLCHSRGADKVINLGTISLSQKV